MIPARRRRRERKRGMERRRGRGIEIDILNYPQPVTGQVGKRILLTLLPLTEEFQCHLHLLRSKTIRNTPLQAKTNETTN